MPVAAAQEGRRERDTVAAWRRYLVSVRALPADRYEEVEPWVWWRLQADLRRLQPSR